MADNPTNRRLLLACFADFYEEVARIKLAIRDGSLAAYLSGELDAGGAELSAESEETSETPRESVPTNGIYLASAVSQRLLSRLREQQRRIRECASDEETRLYRFAQYAMAAHADELFLLELDWLGRDYWHRHLLERKLFSTATSGRDYFVYCDRILAGPSQRALMVDLATVYLTAIQLGFKGQYRGESQRAKLAKYRRDLVHFIGCGQGDGETRLAFPQSYRHLMIESEGARLRPLSRWYRWATLGGLLYLVVSSALWLLSTGHFLAHFANG